MQLLQRGWDEAGRRMKLCVLRGSLCLWPVRLLKPIWWEISKDEFHISSLTCSFRFLPSGQLKLSIDVQGRCLMLHSKYYLVVLNSTWCHSTQLQSLAQMKPALERTPSVGSCRGPSAIHWGPLLGVNISIAGGLKLFLFRLFNHF